MNIVGNGNMKPRFAILAFAVAALTIASANQFAVAQNAIPVGAPIEGTWILQVHRVTQNFTFTAFQSFTAGGVTLATGTVDRTPPPPISPLYGTWQRVGDHSYATSLSFFIFNDAGVAVAMLKNYESFQLNANGEIVGSGEAYICEPTGDNCVNVNLPITFTGKRMNAQL